MEVIRTQQSVGVLRHVIHRRASHRDQRKFLCPPSEVRSLVVVAGRGVRQLLGGSRFVDFGAIKVGAGLSLSLQSDHERARRFWLAAPLRSSLLTHINSFQQKRYFSLFHFSQSSYDT